MHNSRALAHLNGITPVFTLHLDAKMAEVKRTYSSSHKKPTCGPTQLIQSQLFEDESEGLCGTFSIHTSNTTTSKNSVCDTPSFIPSTSLTVTFVGQSHTHNTTCSFFTQKSHTCSADPKSADLFFA